MPTPPRSAPRYTAVSALLAQRAAREARKARSRGSVAVAGTIATHQVASAALAEQAVGQMMLEQDIDVAADALLNSAAFASEMDRMLEAIDKAATDFQFDRLVASLVQDAGRAAQGVAVAARPRIGHVRHLTLPSCSRCAVLAGRVYRYSTGFQRHPGCDCVMIPTTLANDELTYDLADLVRTGQVTGTSKADRKAIRDGADPDRVINVRRLQAGLTESGRVLYRRGRMTPEAIYRKTGDDRDAALALLQRNGYLK